MPDGSSDLVNDLRNAVNDLVRERSIVIRAGVTAIVPSLLDQLAQATEPTAGRDFVAGGMYRSPAHLDVLGLLSEIDAETSAALRAGGYQGRLDFGRRWRVQAWFWTARRHPGYQELALGHARRWVSRGELILTPDPQTIETRAQPCPVCGARTAMVFSEEHGEKIQRASLYLDKTTMTVYCRVCRAEWGMALWGLLCKILEGRE